MLSAEFQFHSSGSSCVCGFIISTSAATNVVSKVSVSSLLFLLLVFLTSLCYRSKFFVSIQSVHADKESIILITDNSRLP